MTDAGQPHLPKANRPFDLLVSHVWSPIFSKGPKRRSPFISGSFGQLSSRWKQLASLCPISPLSCSLVFVFFWFVFSLSLSLPYRREREREIRRDQALHVCLTVDMEKPRDERMVKSRLQNYFYGTTSLGQPNLATEHFETMYRLQKDAGCHLPTQTSDRAGLISGFWNQVPSFETGGIDAPHLPIISIVLGLDHDLFVFWLERGFIAGHMSSFFFYLGM